MALKDIQTETVAEALWEIWSRLGVPEEMLTDRGTQFVSEVMREVNRLLSITGLTTTPWHPQTNGLVEKFNSTLKEMLKKLVMEQPREWDRFLPALLFAYREVPQESLGFSPFEMIYARTLKGPMQFSRQLWTNEDLTRETKTTAEYVTNLRNRIEEACEIAHQNLKKASERHAVYYNKSAKQHELQVGKKVLLLLPTKKNKLELAWRGPYVVKEKVNALDYRIEVGKNLKIVHINLLKEYNERFF